MQCQMTLPKLYLWKLTDDRMMVIGKIDSSIVQPAPKAAELREEEPVNGASDGVGVDSSVTVDDFGGIPLTCIVCAVCATGKS